MALLSAGRLPALRRLGTSVVGVVTAAVLCTACSSSGNGKGVPATSQSGSTSSSTTTSAVPSVGASTAPSVGISSSTSGASSGGAQSAFCKDFTSGDISGLPTTSDKTSLANSAKLFAKLAADAPPEIKSDAQLVSSFLNKYAAGHPDVTDLAKVEPALERILKYATTNCTGG